MRWRRSVVPKPFTSRGFGRQTLSAGRNYGNIILTLNSPVIRPFERSGFQMVRIAVAIDFPLHLPALVAPSRGRDVQSHIALPCSASSMPSKLELSVILTTYERPAHLE